MFLKEKEIHNNNYEKFTQYFAGREQLAFVNLPFQEQLEIIMDAPENKKLFFFQFFLISLEPKKHY